MELASNFTNRIGCRPKKKNVPKGVVERIHLATVDGDVLLGIVGGCGAGGEALRDGLLHVRRVVFRQRTLFPGAGVAWERTLRSIDYVFEVGTGQSDRNQEHLRRDFQFRQFCWCFRFRLVSFEAKFWLEIVGRNKSCLYFPMFVFWTNTELMQTFKNFVLVPNI